MSKPPDQIGPDVQGLVGGYRNDFWSAKNVTITQPLGDIAGWRGTFFIFVCFSGATFRTSAELLATSLRIKFSLGNISSLYLLTNNK